MDPFIMAKHLYDAMLGTFKGQASYSGIRATQTDNRRIAFDLPVIITSTENAQDVPENFAPVEGDEYNVTIGKDSWQDDTKPQPGDKIVTQHLPTLYCIRVTNTFYGWRLRCTTREADDGYNHFDN